MPNPSSNRARPPGRELIDLRQTNECYGAKTCGKFVLPRIANATIDDLFAESDDHANQTFFGRHAPGAAAMFFGNALCIGHKRRPIVPTAALIEKRNDLPVPEVGVEPTPSCEDRILSPARLPFRHSGQPPIRHSTNQARTASSGTSSIESVRYGPLGPMGPQQQARAYFARRSPGRQSPRAAEFRPRWAPAEGAGKPTRPTVPVQARGSGPMGWDENGRIERRRMNAATSPLLSSIGRFPAPATFSMRALCAPRCIWRLLPGHPGLRRTVLFSIARPFSTIGANGRRRARLLDTRPAANEDRPLRRASALICHRDRACRLKTIEKMGLETVVLQGELLR